MKFRFRDRNFSCDRTRLVGILNVTPDSFSDGGKYLSVESAVARALLLWQEGAEIIDIGGESSRPGSLRISEEEEVKRVVPVVKKLKEFCPEIVISVDTMKATVAESVLQAGADIINDISGLRNSQELGKICAYYKAGLILMHMRGTPENMQEKTSYTDLISEIISELEESKKIALNAGIGEEYIMFDPGIGFAKNAEQSLEIILNASKFKNLERPLMFGHSRKSFIGFFTGEKEPEKRLGGTVAISFLLATEGVEFLRVHDIAPNLQAVKLAQEIKNRNKNDA